MADGDGIETLDLRGLNCPLPALRTKRQLRRMAPGERVRVLTTDPLAGIDVPHAAREAGAEVLSRERDEAAGADAFVIAAGDGR